VSFSIPADREEDAAAWLDSEASLGAVTEPAGEGTVRVEAYFPASGPEACAALVAGLRRALGETLDAVIEPVADDGWAERYQAGLEPFPLGSRFVVHPGLTPAFPPPAGDRRLPLILPPGRAFGTGDHPTTALCVEFLERAVEPGMHLLDVGTGSGILALAAVLLGAARVVAVEVDPEALEVARENLAANGALGRVELVLGTTAAVSGGWFDLLAANLRSGTLVEGMADLAHLLRPGGRGVLSGILAGEAGLVEEAALGRGLEVRRTSQGGEWVALEVRKPAR
jgi:ribosomal protein L11 methyltransferase